MYISFKTLKTLTTKKQYIRVTSSIFISVFNQLDVQNFCCTVSLFHASTCFEHHVLIIRRSKLHYTASGIIAPIGGRLLHRLRERDGVWLGGDLCDWPIPHPG